MTKIIIIEKENCKEDSIDDMNNLFKKCKFKKQEDFLELMSWNFKNFTLKLFGKVKGKSHTKFLYKFPNFEKKMFPSPGIHEHPIARLEMMLRPVESECNVLQFRRVKPSK